MISTPIPAAMLDEALKSAVNRGAVAGAEALVLVEDQAVYHGSAGFLRKIPKEIPLKAGCWFDLASLTKVVCTTTAIMLLADRGLVRIDAPAWSYIPEFGCRGKERVTLRHLLTHTSGLVPFKPFFRDHRGKQDFYNVIAAMDLMAEPGKARVYSDLGFIMLGWVVERVSGEFLDRFASENIFQPLGMRDTFFRPPLSKRRRCAATEDCPFRKGVIQGEVHDENAWQMGGVSGHAGLFSTVEDLAIFCRMMLAEGCFGAGRLLSRDAFRQMLSPQHMPDGNLQALGWWFKRREGEATVFLPSDHSFGHTGFTGTSIWIDPVQKAAVILLANAIHPHRETADAASLRKQFHQVVSGWLQLVPAPA